MLLGENTLLVLNHRTRGEQTKQLLTQVRNFPLSAQGQTQQNSPTQHTPPQNTPPQNTPTQANQQTNQSAGQPTNAPPPSQANLEKGIQPEARSGIRPGVRSGIRSGTPQQNTAINTPPSTVTNSNILQVKIQSITPGGYATLLLPSGQIFEAQLPRTQQNLPINTALLLQVHQKNAKKDTPQIAVLRALLPATKETPTPQLKPSSTPPVLLDINIKTPQVGQTLHLTSQQQNIVTAPLFTQKHSHHTQNLDLIHTGHIRIAQGQNQDQHQGQNLLTLQNGTKFFIKGNPFTRPQAESADTLLPQAEVKIRFTAPTTATLLDYNTQKTPLNWVLNPADTHLIKTSATLNVHVHQHSPTKLTLITKQGQALHLTPTAPIHQNQNTNSNIQPNIQPSTPPNTHLIYPKNIALTVEFSAQGILKVLDAAPAQTPPLTNANIRLDSSTQNALQTQNTSQHATGQPITGQVIGHTPEGGATLELNQGLRIPITAQKFLPLGSQVTFVVTADGHGEITQISLPQGSQRHNAVLQFSTRWEGLHKAFNALERSNPELAQKVIANFPRANEGLLPHLIHFAKGIAEQNLKVLFGEDTLNILRALGLDGMLKADMSQLNSLQTPRNEQPEGWRALFFPYWEDQEETLRQGAFFWRKQKNTEHNKAESIRFILNAHLTNLGQVQLDGLMYEEKNLKLKLHTQNILTPTEQKNLQLLVQESIIALNLEGSITIRQVNFFPIDPQREMLINSHDNAKIINNYNIEA